VKEAPEIIFSLRDERDHLIPFGFRDRDPLFVSHRERFGGDHTPRGILLAFGKRIRAIPQIEASIVDIVPTILAELGLGIPRQIDGHCLNHIFMNDSRPPVVFSEMNDCEFYVDQRHTPDEDETKQIEKQLRGLGYL
jgi:hypothetical protein